MDIDEFREEISSYGLNPEELLAIIKDIYLAYELPIKVCFERTCTILYNISSEDIEILKSLGIINEFAKGTYSAGREFYARARLAGGEPMKISEKALRSGRVFYIQLSSTGEEIARQYIEILLDMYSSFLKDIFIKYPRAYIGLLGFIGKDKDDKLLRVTMNPREVGEKSIPSTYLIYDFTSWLEELLKTIDILHAKTVKLLQELRKTGLAISYPLYDSKGIYIDDAISTRYTIINHTTHLINAEAPEDIVKSLFKIYLLIQGSTESGVNFFRTTLSQDPMLTLEIRAYLDLLNKKRITTKLNEKPSKPPFIVLNKELFYKEINKQIKSIASKLVANN